ncbi:MAG TPA: hypothetical protein PKD24_05550 [Pyrinomonadaceae bacterium]|nr:hypothetical protein [Pyrinomonadaceae bacterium]HMP65016.1 hypothetical protein [Pyrinomonadaceae bacterium]
MHLFRKSFLFSAAVFIGAVVAGAQTPINPSPPPPGSPNIREPRPRTMRDMVEQRRIQRQRRDHEEMLQRAESAVKLAEELELAAAEKDILSASDRKKLDDLERLVTRIRRDLGGGNDGLSLDDDEEIESPNSFRDAASALKEITVKLFEELKQTSRFSISAVAIRSTNTALRIARFLKIRR